MKKEVKVLGLSYSQGETGSYIIVLSEKNGSRKIPVIVKPSDAQQIALKIEGIKYDRPLTHDLVKTITDSFSIYLTEVYIHSLLEGVFYTSLVFTDGAGEVTIECSSGDGITLAIVYDCPLFVSTKVLKEAGININDDGTSIDNEDAYIDESETCPENNKRVVSVEDLQRMMEEAIKNEEYEIAAELRDQINLRGK